MVHFPVSMNQSNLYSQKLNNSAALCIEIGHYDRAIFSLTKALRISRAQTDEGMLCVCRCRSCSLDGCIAYTESSPPVAKLAQQTTTSMDIVSRCNGWGCGYVYRRPIRVPPQSILENHNMGRILFLIITFNLALAHHLSAIATATPMTTPAASSGEDKAALNQSQEQQRQQQLTQSGSRKAKMLKKALQLYEVSNYWHSRITASMPLTGHDCDLAGGLSSIRFQMILSNNLSHIHCLSSDQTKQQEFLENLLSTVMVAVEYQTRSNNSSNSSSSNNHRTNDSESTSHEGDLCTKHLEGFMMNASRLFLCRHCADAA